GRADRGEEGGFDLPLPTPPWNDSGTGRGGGATSRPRAPWRSVDPAGPQRPPPQRGGRRPRRLRVRPGASPGLFLGLGLGRLPGRLLLRRARRTGRLVVVVFLRAEAEDVRLPPGGGDDSQAVRLPLRPRRLDPGLLDLPGGALDRGQLVGQVD